MQPLNTTVMSWGDALITSLTAAMAMLFAAIPRLLGFILILIIGWFVAGLVAKLVAGILRSVNLDHLAARSGFSSFVANMGVNTDASGIIALCSKWFIRLIVLVVAFDALGLPAVSDVPSPILAVVAEPGRGRSRFSYRRSRGKCHGQYCSWFDCTGRPRESR